MSAPPDRRSPEIITVVPGNGGGAVKLPDLGAFQSIPSFSLPAGSGEAAQGTAGVVEDWPFSPLNFGLPSPSANVAGLLGDGKASGNAFSFVDDLAALLPDQPGDQAMPARGDDPGDGMNYSATGATPVANSLALQTRGGDLQGSEGSLQVKSEESLAIDTIDSAMDLAGGAPVPGAIVPYDPAFSAQQHLTATPEELVGNIDWAMNVPDGALEFANWDEKEAHILPPTDMASITDEQLGYIDLKLLMDLMHKAGYTEAQIQATKTRRRKIKNRNSAKGSASKRRVQMNSIANVNKRLVQVVTGLQHQNSQLHASNNNLRQRMDIAAREATAAQAERQRYQAEIDRLDQLVKTLSTSQNRWLS